MEGTSDNVLAAILLVLCGFVLDRCLMRRQVPYGREHFELNAAHRALQVVGQLRIEINPATGVRSFFDRHGNLTYSYVRACYAYHALAGLEAVGQLSLLRPRDRWTAIQVLEFLYEGTEDEWYRALYETGSRGQNVVAPYDMNVLRSYTRMLSILRCTAG